MTTGEWVRASRAAKAWSQTVLGEKVGVSQAQVSQWERDGFAPSSEQRSKLEAVLGAASNPTSVSAPGAETRLPKPEPKPLPTGGPPAPDDPVTVQELESHLWEAANILRGSPVDRADWKSCILPLLSFKRICDVWDEEHRSSVELYGEGYEDEHRFLAPEGCHWRDVRATRGAPGRRRAPHPPTLRPGTESHDSVHRPHEPRAPWGRRLRGREGRHAVRPQVHGPGPAAHLRRGPRQSPLLDQAVEP